MLKADAVKHFETEAGVARALGINKSSVNRWGRLVPPFSAMRIAEITDDALPFDRSRYKHWRSRGRRPAVKGKLLKP